MRKIIKIVVIFLAERSPVFCNYLKNSSFIRTPIGLSIINMIVQRFFRINSDVIIPVNFTSRVTGYKNITHYHDRSTLMSFSISGGVYIQAVNGIKLGRNFLFAPNVKIISANHDFLQREKATVAKPIIIGDNVWVGANAIILPEVEIGNNCIVGAGSVVTKSFADENLVIAGNPAKIIRRL